MPEIRSHQGDPEAALACLTKETPAARRLVVSHSLARHWLQATVTGARSLKELQAIAAGRCAQLFGGRPQSWRVAGDWQAGQPFLCAALPSLWAETLSRLPAGTPRMETSLQAALARTADTLPDNGWVVLREEGQAALMHLSDGRLHGLRVIHLPPDTTTAAPVAATSLSKPLAERPGEESPDTVRFIADECVRWALREGWTTPTELIDLGARPLNASATTPGADRQMPRWKPWTDLNAVRVHAGKSQHTASLDFGLIEPSARDAVAALWAALPQPEGWA
ncbi:hypothetical protein [Roseateles amylovorans]|uniref:Uncharacterized protein n=1 Tax=Roseateles amylovorans TaxID=2978473 RepID=A0ABY6ASS7_9BURK|nr:hypothetical protein [Roseateles amylovorans]UXH76062.1 hypothetical protein N4261_13355 [Roseateles amylovorans]